jgi:hypothetical protein
LIKNFVEVKRQLAELSEVINSYKSETVQLRIVELVLGGRGEESEELPEDEAEEKEDKPKRRGRRRAKSASGSKDSPTKDASTPERPARPGRPSGLATLNSLVTEGFFKKPKTLSEIVKHCETTMALHYKQSNFSGPLIRLVRDRKLTREKNAEGQYVYKQA